jgi:hypothetical protein
MDHHRLLSLRLHTLFMYIAFRVDPSVGQSKLPLLSQWSIYVAYVRPEI